MRCGQGAAGAVVQAGIAFGSPAPDPFVGGSAGASHFIGDVGDGPAGPNPVDQEPSAVHGESGIGMGQKNLLLWDSSDAAAGQVGP